LQDFGPETAAIIEALAKAKKGAAFSAMARPIYASEAVLSLRELNGEEVQAMGEVGSGNLMLWGVENFKDLSPLRDKQITSLNISGARNLDWATIQALPLETLDLSKCHFESFPLSARVFPKLRSLSLAGTPVSSLDFLRAMQRLEVLDISDTKVTDLALIRSSSRLQELNLAGLNPANLRQLSWLPLRTLTVSPALVTDKVALNQVLRLHKNLKTLRAPEDSPQQPTAEFWRKFDAGLYNPPQ